MINKTWSRKFVAILVAAAILSVYSMLTLATTARTAGELSVTGNVSVDGQKAVSGGTIFSGSLISTAKDSSATISLGKLGRVELAAGSSLRLTFAESAITGLLDAGRARVSTAAGVSVNLTTKDGSVVADGKQATAFTVDTENGNTIVNTESGIAELHSGTTVSRIAAGESGVAGTPQGGSTKKDDGDHKLSGGALVALLAATGGAVAAIIYATTHKNDLNFGGTVNVVSPTK
jgi:ferric-dicitrate binding protein FerR (iron transport regulator)